MREGGATPFSQPGGDGKMSAGQLNGSVARRFFSTRMERMRNGSTQI